MRPRRAWRSLFDIPPLAHCATPGLLEQSANGMEGLTNNSRSQHVRQARGLPVIAR